jgi:hypothetical protein
MSLVLLLLAMTVTSLDLNAYRPPDCIPEGQRCYRTSNKERQNRFSSCCKDARTGAVYMTCQGGPWNDVCTKCPWNNCTQQLPAWDPKGFDGVDWGVTSVALAMTTAGLNPKLASCPALANLGPLVGASTGYSEPFPLLGNSNVFSPAGREFEIALLVGGNYYAPLAAEVEGNIIVLGDVIIGASGTNSLGMLLVLLLVLLLLLLLVHAFLGG